MTNHRRLTEESTSLHAISEQSARENKSRRITGLGIIIVVLAAAGWAVSRPQAEPEIDAELVGLQAGGSTEGFAQALEPRAFQFPRDHGPHPEYQTEWWYYTGNLDTESGQHFGYQLTFFRRALTPEAPQRTSDWATNQIYMAHLTVTDVANERFHNFERFSRGAAGLAGASSEPYRVWLESWSVEQTEPGVVHLRAAEEDVALDLTLRQTKPAALHGDAGLSQKSSAAGNASYYYSLTRLETAGSVTISGGTPYDVAGLSWMDHEFGTSYLAESHTGWDWFSLQLDDQHELMFFQIREEDGGIEPLSGGSLIEPDGTVHPLDLDEVTLEVLDTWASPQTDATYPAGWRLSVPSTDLTLEIQPFMNAQELDVSYAYWEGAVKVTGQHGNRSVSGAGYVELTGYAGSMRGEF